MLVLQLRQPCSGLDFKGVKNMNAMHDSKNNFSEKY